MISPWLYPLLFFTALVAGFVDSIAGGGGLITIPVLLNLGMTPQDALGTNKLQSTFGSGSATLQYARAGLIDFRECVSGIGFSAIGAGLGTWLVIAMGRNDTGKDILRHIIPWLIIAIAVYMLLQPKVGETDLRPRMNASAFHVVFGLGIGCYDGFFGPGTGTFWAMAYMTLLGFNMTRATAHTKAMNFASNVASLGVFLSAGHAYVGAGLCMAAGAWIGARLGSRTVVKKGVKFIRPVFITVALAITARLLWQNFAKPTN